MKRLMEKVQKITPLILIKFLLKKETIFFICVTLWNLYDSYNCLAHGMCGWKRYIYIENFSILRLMYLLFNIFLQLLLLGGFIVYIQLNYKKPPSTHRKKSKNGKKDG